MSTEETTTTTIPPCAQEPPPEDAFCGPINEPATVGEPVATRGEQAPLPTIEERCLDGSLEWSFRPCETETSVAVGQPPTLTLPETGASADIAIVAGVAVVVGTILYAIRKWAPADKEES